MTNEISVKLGRLIVSLFSTVVNLAFVILFIVVLGFVAHVGLEAAVLGWELIE